MKYCSHCGNEIMDEAVVCVKCGCAVGQATSNGVTQPQNLVQQLSDRVKINGIIWLVIGVLQLLLGLFIEWFFLIVGILNIVTAVQDINYSKDDYSDNKKIMTKVSDLSEDIESELYNKIKSADIAISECNTYLEFYPNGKYVKEVKVSLTAFTEKQAIQDISKAKTAIQQNDILEAGSLLQSIIDNTNVSEDTKKQAQEVLNPIANKVYAEKGKKAILGSWTKETGVTYTFEENGHMSVSMASNYNSSAGTALDGIEVLSLLSEIEDFSRIVQGGTWEYEGTQTIDSETFYVYNLFYCSSQHTCLIPVKDSWKMGITLSSGFGDMSILTK